MYSQSLFRLKIQTQILCLPKSTLNPQFFVLICEIESPNLVFVIVNLNPDFWLGKFSEKPNGELRRDGLKHRRFKGDLRRLHSSITEKGIDFFFFHLL